MLPYDNHNNPFHDEHLDKVFLWKKKAKQLGWSKSEAKVQAENLRLKNLQEIQLAKKRRIEREEEISRKLQERERLERERDSASYVGWEQREEQFMLKQHQQASAMRINQGRERPVDRVARNFLLTKQLKQGPEIGADGKAVALLGDDVGIENQSPLELFAKLSHNELLQLKEDLLKYKRLESSTNDFSTFWDALLVVCEDELNPPLPNAAVPSAVRDSIREACSTKTLKELKVERADAMMRANSSAPNSDDFLFYSELDHRLAIEEARAYIREFHEGMVQTAKDNGRAVHNVQNREIRQGDSILEDIVEESELGEEQTESAFFDLVDIPVESNSSQEGLVKPRYWNRVRSGYDWNKYNRAHYDRDNPPPKAIFGYKFNILYPGLKQTPSYIFERDHDDPNNYCIIRFRASPPYADIAFRIEKKEWERGSKSGFKNTFENGVLQLHFNFTRRRYRR